MATPLVRTLRATVLAFALVLSLPAGAASADEPAPGEPIPDEAFALEDSVPPEAPDCPDPADVVESFEAVDCAETIDVPAMTESVAAEAIAEAETIAEAAPLPAAETFDALDAEADNPDPLLDLGIDTNDPSASYLEIATDDLFASDPETAADDPFALDASFIADASPIEPETWKEGIECAPFEEDQLVGKPVAADPTCLGEDDPVDDDPAPADEESAFLDDQAQPDGPQDAEPGVQADEGTPDSFENREPNALVDTTETEATDSPVEPDQPAELEGDAILTTEASSTETPDVTPNESAPTSDETLSKSAEPLAAEDPGSVGNSEPSPSAASTTKDETAEKVATSLEAAKPKNGWVTENGVKRYYTNGKAASGLKQINGAWYYFNPGTKGMVSSKFVYISNDKKTCYFGKDGKMRFGEQKMYGFTYLFDSKTGARTDSKLMNVSGNKTIYYNRLGHLAKGEELINGKWYFFDPSSGAQMSVSQIIDHFEKQARSVLGSYNGRQFEDALLAAGGKLCWGVRGQWCGAYLWWAFNKAGLTHFYAGGKPLSQPQHVYDYYASIGRAYWRNAYEGYSMEGVRRGDIVFVDYGALTRFGIYDRATHIAYCIGTDENGYYCIEGNVPNVSIQYRSYYSLINRGFARPSYS